PLGRLVDHPRELAHDVQRPLRAEDLAVPQEGLPHPPVEGVTCVRASVQSYFLWSAGAPLLSSDPSSMSSWMSIQFWKSSRHDAVRRASSSDPPNALQLVTQMKGRMPFPPRS